jgi:NAD(P) transhydrogenase subunit alpha
MKLSMLPLLHMAARDVPQMALGRESEGEVMEAIAIISIFVLAVFVGFEVVSKVSSTLHTPLMSGANAIHGVILVGAIIVADHAETSLELGLSVAAIVLATINMVGGFVVTDRMLEMFKGKGARDKNAENKSAGDKK